MCVCVGEGGNTAPYLLKNPTQGINSLFHVTPCFNALMSNYLNHYIEMHSDRFADLIVDMNT